MTVLVVFLLVVTGEISLTDTVVVGYEASGPMKNVLQLSRGESLEPFFCHQKREGVSKSFFSEYGSIAVNSFGDIAFFGEHRALNGGKPTLFLVNRADNRLRMLVRTREADRPTSSTKIGKALNEHMATVSSPA